MSRLARTTCLACQNGRLHIIGVISEDGIPHGVAGHNFTHTYWKTAVCQACHHGVIEQFSHDCYGYYGDEDWDMYWWYALSPADTAIFQDHLAACPSPLDGSCDCPLHVSLRAACADFRPAVPHASFPEENGRFTWLRVFIHGNHIGFTRLNPV